MRIATEMTQRRSTQDTFGTVLRRIRLAKALTQRAVARAIGMDFAYFSRLESDALASLPTRATIEKIADAMPCTVDEKAELLAAAGRVSEEMQTRPELRRLFRTATQLWPAVLEELVREAEERLKLQKETQSKRRKKDGPPQGS
jgi:transcriptional regulator with XRE-family HTH domain